MKKRIRPRAGTPGIGRTGASRRPLAFVPCPGQLALDLGDIPRGIRKKVKRFRRAKVETIPLDLGPAGVPVPLPDPYVGPMPEWSATYERIEEPDSDRPAADGDDDPDEQ